MCNVQVMLDQILLLMACTLLVDRVFIQKEFRHMFDHDQ